MSPKAAGLAEKAGYKNVKVFLDGMPAWKKAKNLVVVESKWLSKELGPSLVVLDVRTKAKSSASSIKTAVAIDSQSILELGEKFANKKRGKKKGELYKNRILPSLADKTAPIIVFGDSTTSPEALKAYKELVGWKYKSVAVLEGGFDAWAKAKLPQAGAVLSIVYVKAKVPGAVSIDDFIAQEKSGSAVILDVRTAKEQKKGAIKNAVLIPLENLEAGLSKLPKDKPVIAHCSTGVRAEIAYNLLKNKGFDKISFLNNIISISKAGVYSIE